MTEITGRRRLDNLRTKPRIKAERNLRKFLAREIGILPESDLDESIEREFDRLCAEKNRSGPMDLVHRLRVPVTANSDPGLTNAERREAADTIERLGQELGDARTEIEHWQDRVEAERQAHEATIREYEKARE